MLYVFWSFKTITLICGWSNYITSLKSTTDVNHFHYCFNPLFSIYMKSQDQFVQQISHHLVLLSLTKGNHQGQNILHHVQAVVIHTQVAGLIKFLLCMHLILIVWNWFHACIHSTYYCFLYYFLSLNHKLLNISELILSASRWRVWWIHGLTVNQCLLVKMVRSVW